MSLQIDHAATATAAGASAAASVATASLNLGLPLPSLLAAFAGASLILSFLPHLEGDEKRLVRLVATVVFCTILGTLFGPATAAWLNASGIAALGVAFGIGAGGQVIIPVIIERRRDIYERLTSVLPGRNRNGGGDK